MTALAPILLAAGWCLLHLAAYLAGLRNLAVLRTERGIFLFHALPVAAAGLALLVWLALAPGEAARWTGAFGTAALMGIYAISFLELWSLAEGSYSLSILAATDRRGTASGKDLQDLAAIGTAKQKARTASLLELKLARRDAEGRLAITGRGRAAAAASAALLWLAGIGRAG